MHQPVQVIEQVIFGVEIFVANYKDLSNCILDKIFRMRKEVFIDRRKWSIESYEGGVVERDEYDNEEAYYLCAYLDKKFAGCVRLRPSSSATLLTGPLKWLKEPVDFIPATIIKWEASRFFITKNNKNNEDEQGVDRRTQALFLGMIQFARANGFENYEVVVDALMARLLRVCGWPLCILNTGVGTLDEKIYYGLLHCGEEEFEKIKNIVIKKFFLKEPKSIDNSTFKSNSNVTLLPLPALY